jgi:hypothetical protein
LYFLYRISRSYDGFTPDKIRNRMGPKETFKYNWPQYFDQIERGDIVFTYFVGKGVKKGVYFIAKITKRSSPNIAEAKVLTCDIKNPILSDSDLSPYKEAIFNRPRGSVFAIPTFLDPIFDEVLKCNVISDIKITEQIDCYTCFQKKQYKCEKCSISFLYISNRS